MDSYFLNANSTSSVFILRKNILNLNSEWTWHQLNVVTCRKFIEKSLIFPCSTCTYCTAVPHKLCGLFWGSLDSLVSDNTKYGKLLLYFEAKKKKNHHSYEVIHLILFPTADFHSHSILFRETDLGQLWR